MQMMGIFLIDELRKRWLKVYKWAYKCVVVEQFFFFFLFEYFSVFALGYAWIKIWVEGEEN